MAVIDEGFVEHQARIGLRLRAPALASKTMGLLRAGSAVALGSSPACQEWSTGRALAAGASEDEIAHVLLAIAPGAGLGRIAAPAPELAMALGYDVEAALEEPGDY